MAVITISQQYGSGGDEIAVRVCGMLGYRFYDKKLMARAASEMGILEQELVDFSEDNYEVRGFLDRLLGRDSPRTVKTIGTWKQNTSGVRVPETEVLDEAQCIAMVKGAVRSAYKRGNVVGVGRGGQAILQEKPDVLHVRIVAPRDGRIQRIQEREKMSKQAAQELVTQRDKAAAAYLKRFYDIDWSDPTLYHLVINTGKWDVEAAAHLIVNAVSYMPPAESSG